MTVINVLDKNTINQIAAGEVIERPASVVKELIENSIDAGAGSVTCEIKGGGIELIRITDNGHGIDSEYVRTAFLRHATSKIKTAEDLTGVMSLGFRGEALASIAAVAEVELLTKTRSSFTGIRYIILGGEEISCEEIGCPDGTTFIVRNLFGNVPVRRKFLKSAQTEAAYINEFIERVAMSHPDVSIKYINNGKTVLFTNGNNSIKNNIYSIYGREITAALTEINDERNGIKITGYVAGPTVARSNRNLENYYVNGRFIRNNIICKAIEDAFHPYLMQHKYPFTALCLEVPGETMDVNVHPTKQEVRFENGEKIYDAVYHAVFDALSNKSLVHKDTEEKTVVSQANGMPPVKGTTMGQERDKLESLKRFLDNTGLRNESSIGCKNESPSACKNESLSTCKNESSSTCKNESPSTLTNASEAVKNTSFVVNVTDEKKIHPKDNCILQESVSEYKSTPEYKAPKPGDIPEPFEKGRIIEKQFMFDFEASEKTRDTVIREETKEEFKKGLKEGYNIVGQVFNTYWFVERGEELYMIDQHAAHEKIIYERLMKENAENVNNSQRLSPPIIITLNPTEQIALQENISDLTSAGFCIEGFGGREYAVSEIPMQLYGLDAKELLMELISSFTETDRRKNRNQTITLKERIATCSCKAAVKGNTRLSVEEARKLIEDLLKLDNPFNCPHGRPIVVSMTKQDIEKKFKRIVD